MPDPKPPVAEMKRLLFARIAELRELTANPCGCRVYCAQHQIAHKIFRASLDAHEAFLKRESNRITDPDLYIEYIAQIQALYEALCGGKEEIASE